MQTMSKVVLANYEYCHAARTKLSEDTKRQKIKAWQCDLLVLIVGRAKIQSTPINAFVAQLQASDSNY